MTIKMPAQRWTSLLLLIAFLHGVLAPSLSVAVGKDEFARTMLVPLCGADGHQLVEIELSEPDAFPDAATESGHAGFCLLCLYSAAAPRVGIAAFLPALSFSSAVFLPDDPQPYLSRVWNPSLARAPPPDA